ncbi:ABC transporter substrate-binding protein [Clostridium sp.]|uniref:ABC transporter substrate-binding protein n=1 Tax=Clostridium sp. TaxID=1506 RepID=UPI0025B88C7B|nr:ABC transporter substrate-binding protein [Clostridium sp.]MCI9303368.1 ABC transporter substrate-binding protein [Clostridium sp.]
MKKRLLTIVLTSILGVTSLVGCSNNSLASNKSWENTKITFWHSMGGKGGEAINSLVDEFNNSQDKINVVAEYQGSYDDSINKLKSSALSNSGPDVMQLYDIGTKWMIDSEYAIPMQDMIDKNDYDIASLEKNILDYYTIDGKLYSMPFNSSTPILFYNKTAFSEAGLTDKDIPTNFKEIIEVSSKLAVKEGDKVSRYGYAMQIYGWFFEQFLIKQGLDYANEGNGRKGDATEVVFNSNDGALNIIEGWKELVDSGVVGNFGRDSQNTLDAFSSGNVAMIVASTASLGDLKSKIGDNFELGTAYFPSVLERDNGGVSVGGASLWIMNNGDDERENAAFEFIKFMVSEQTQVKWSQATGYFSVSKKAYELPEMVEYLNKNPEFKTAIEQLREENNSSGAILGIFPEARASIEENIEKVLNNEITSKEAVKNMSKTINSALEKYNKSNK